MQYPAEEDWGKLSRVLHYLKTAKDDKRIMGSENLLKLDTWVDASHAVHEDMRGDTGGCMFCGVIIIHGKASKQKLNKKSTTESEVVAVSDYMPLNIHMINIFWGQYYALHKTVFYQYNEIAIKMEKNGRNSCTGNSRHISISSFLLSIMWIRSSLVSITATHRQYLPTYSLNHCKGHFFGGRSPYPVTPQAKRRYRIDRVPTLPASATG